MVHVQCTFVPQDHVSSNRDCNDLPYISALVIFPCTTTFDHSTASSNNYPDGLATRVCSCHDLCRQIVHIVWLVDFLTILRTCSQLNLTSTAHLRINRGTPWNQHHQYSSDIARAFGRRNHYSVSICVPAFERAKGPLTAFYTSADNPNFGPTPGLWSIGRVCFLSSFQRSMHVLYASTSRHKPRQQPALSISLGPGNANSTTLCHLATSNATRLDYIELLVEDGM